MAAGQGRCLLHQNTQGFGIPHCVQMGLLGGSDRLCRLFHPRLRIDQALLVIRCRQGCQRLLEPVQRSAIVFGLLFVLVGDRLPCRADLLALGRLLRRLHRPISRGIGARRRPQFRQLLVDLSQRSPGPRHFAGLGGQQRKPRGTRPGTLGPVLGSSQCLRRSGEGLMLFAQDVQFFLYRRLLAPQALDRPLGAGHQGLGFPRIA